MSSGTRRVLSASVVMRSFSILLATILASLTLAAPIARRGECYFIGELRSGDFEAALITVAGNLFASH
jgi:hypothetical protein